MPFIDPATVVLSPSLASVGLATGPVTPSEAVTQRFNEIMNAAATSKSVAPALPAGAHVGLTASVAEPAGPGNSILAGLQSVPAEYSNKWRSVKSSLDEMSRNPSAGTMLAVQMGLLEMSVLYELVGKGISRSTQNIDTLVRMS